MPGQKKQSKDLFAKFESAQPADQETMLQTYQSHLTTARDLVRNYRGSKKEYQTVFTVLLNFERWMADVFGEPNGANDNIAQRLTHEQETLIHEGFTAHEQNSQPMEKQRTIEELLATAAQSFQVWFSKIAKDNGVEAALTILNVPVKNLPGVILPPKDTTKIEKGSGTGLDEFREMPRMQQLIAFLNRNEIFTDDIQITAGELLPNQMRESTYYLVEIPSLQRSILVCNEVGEATFIVKTYINPKLLLTLDKESLQKQYPTQVSRIIYSNQDQWETSLYENIFISNKLLQSGTNAQKNTPMDKAYFEDPIKVRNDLEAYALADGRSVEDLSVIGNSIEVLCSSGETMKFNTYLSHAGIALGLAKDSPESRRIKSTTIAKLKSIIGIDTFSEMDADYFNNPIKVDADLTLFAMAAGKESVEDLFATRAHKITSHCSNGESLTFLTYLNRAGIALGIAKGTVEAMNLHAPILAKLKSIIGIEEQTFSEMDADYFNNPVKVRADLKLFTEATGKEYIEDLKTSYSHTINIICANGEPLSLKTYLYRAEIALGFAKKSQAGAVKPILRRLKSIIGIKTFDEMDEDYFSNTPKIDADLTLFAMAAGKDSVENLSTHKADKIKTHCTTEEPVSLNTYLNRAGIKLKMGKNSQQTQKIHGPILQKLKSIIGISEQKRAS